MSAQYHPKGCRAVLQYLSDGQWTELADIAWDCRLSPTGASARIRDLRKRPWNLTVEARPGQKRGPWVYRVNAKSAAKALRRGR